MRRFLAFVISALSLGSVSAAIFYVLFKKDDQDDFDQSVITTEQVVIKVQIPKDLVGVFIGRGGGNVRRIQEESGARIRVDRDCNPEDDVRDCTIYGAPALAQNAETLIRQFIHKQPKIETHEMAVPMRSIGCIIGRNGERIRTMSRYSGAKIGVEDFGMGEAGKVTIKGTQEQIDHAQKLISEAVAETEVMLNEQALSIQNRSPRVQPRNESNNVPRLESPVGNSQSDTLCPPGGEQSWEVFVSSVDSPDQFWVQVINERAKKLDELTEEMTEYYSTEENQELHKISDLSEGKIVAAPFPVDDKFYRARVRRIFADEQGKVVNVHFVDYGDESDVQESQVLELRTDFLTLRYQAIECFLDGIAPSAAQWSQEAIDLFEDLAGNARWVPRKAVFKTYPDWNRASHQDVDRAAYAVQLFTTNGDELINIGDELIRQGFATRHGARAEAGAEAGAFQEESTAGSSFRGVPELSDSESDIDGFYID